MIISIIKYLVPLVIGLISIYLAVRKKYQGSITFVNEQTIELFDAIGNSLEDLKVTYKDDLVSENLILLNGAFYNSGYIDISKDLVETPITCSLPEGCEWLTGKIIDTNSTATFNCENKNSFKISTGLFRKDEYVRFHALAKIPIDNLSLSKKSILQNSMKFSHRICNVKKITTAVYDKSNTTKKFLGRIIPFGIITAMSLLIILANIFASPQKALAYEYNLEDNKSILCTVSVMRNGLIKLDDLESSNSYKVTLDNYLNNSTLIPQLVEKKDIFTLITYIIQFIIFSIMSIYVIKKYISNKKIGKIIGIYNKNSYSKRKNI